MEEFPLLELPNELLYKICECLNAHDLRRFALVNERTRSIAQKTLHVSPDLTTGKWNRQLSLLAKTLFLRPDLAKVVRHLAIVARDGVPVEVDCPAELALDDRNVGEDTVNDEQRLTGHILACLPQLRVLKVMLIAEVEEYSDDTFSALPMNGLFGDAAVPGDITRISGLRHLESLELHASQLDWSWCLLPRLKQLSLSQGCNILDYGVEAGTPSLEELKLVLDTTALIPQEASYRNVSPFLARLGALKVLRLYLHNSPYDPLSEDYIEILSATARGKYSALLEILSPVCPSLEVLQFGLHRKWYFDHGDYFDWVQPADTFTSFRRLKILTISQEGLLGLMSDKMRKPAQLLPNSLEKLRLLYPRTTIYSWLEQIPLCREQLPHIQVVVLWITVKRGDPYESLRYTTKYTSIKSDFRDVGIQLELQCSPSTFREEWKDEDYDPCTSNLAEFLSILSPESS